MTDWEQLTSGPGHAEFALPLEYQERDDIFYHHHIRKGHDHFYLGDPELDALATKSAAWAKREETHEAQVRGLAKYARMAEWGTGVISKCPECKNYKSEGHTSDCGFVAALAPFEEVA